jgi:hypothetical protein
MKRSIEDLFKLIESDYPTGEVFRVRPITRFIKEAGKMKFVEMPVSYGLSVEQKVDDSYIVIVTYKYDEDIVVEEVGDRVINALDSIVEKYSPDYLKVVSLVEEFNNMSRFAYQAVLDANEDK